MRLSEQEIERQRVSLENYKALRPTIFDSKAIAQANTEHQLRERLYKEANAPSTRDALLTSLTGQRAAWAKMGRPTELIDEQIGKIHSEIATEKKHAKTIGSAEYKETEVFVKALKALTSGDTAAHHQIQLAHDSYLTHEDNDRYKKDIEHLWTERSDREAKRRAEATVAVDKSNMEAAFAQRDEAIRQVEFDRLAADAKGLVS